MRILNFVLAVMFLIFAFLQVNDPDPVLWILVYGVMAVFCVMAMFSFYPRKALWVVLVAMLAYSIIYVPGVREWWDQPEHSALFDNVAKMEHLYIEEAREFLGLMICVIVVVFHLMVSRRRTAA
ncbi:hypothetical protein KK062_27000 [Fulvivirgaceae bacterium PWU5]|uniref:Transmembrane family 220, helix n=1 Tax=Dawidia cretensis TaxID=2782350 RepID=A0AAP2E2K2_9BACT|nr:transmembrane 220 family protein [Dawidia cretensis]MBT1711920.1 hypothetical protein [Dawidia cretensis]